MALFHCMVRHGTVKYGSLLFFFPLGTVPGRDGNSSQRLGLESHLSRINKDSRLDLDS